MLGLRVQPNAGDMDRQTYGRPHKIKILVVRIVDEEKQRMTFNYFSNYDRKLRWVEVWMLIIVRMEFTWMILMYFNGIEWLMKY